MIHRQGQLIHPSYFYKYQVIKSIRKMVKPKEDLTGRRFGKLLVIGFESKKGWKCLCDCGNIRYNTRAILINGKSKSCGCNQYENKKYIIHPKLGHKVFHPEIIGKVFGHLTVIKSVGYIDNSKDRTEQFLCKCDCGVEKIISYSSLIRGNARSCGSGYHRIKHDLTNMRFGKLVAIKPSAKKAKGGLNWDCVCDCGNTTIVNSNNLIRPDGTRSCGCVMKERKERKKKYMRLRRIWTNMKMRCGNPNDSQYKNYGERGIKVCDDWLKFNSFVKWAENHGYKNPLSLERIDVNGNYCPENCKWIPLRDQSLNKRNTRRFLYNGEMITIKELSDRLGLKYYNVRFHHAKGDLEEWLRCKGLIT